MNGETIYEFVTELLGGDAPGDVLFRSMLNMAKTTRESTRDWVALRTKYSSLSYTTSAQNLPSNFLKALKQTAKSDPVVFIDSNGKKQGTASEILVQQQYDYQDQQGYFYVEYGTTPTITFTGANLPAYTPILFYIKKTDEMTEANQDTWTWSPFPSDYTYLLAFDVANMIKGGVDYDDINARMVQFAGIDAQKLEHAMRVWDDRIKLSALNV